MKALKRKLFIFFTITLLSMPLAAQNEHSIIGQWQLQKVSFKKTTASASNDQEQLLAFFAAALFKRLTAEQRLTIEDLEELNANAELLRDKYHQTTIAFKASGAFYNRSKISEDITSGEYLLHGKKLHLEWETAEKKTYKILKITENELLLIDSELKIIYQNIKLKSIKPQQN